jgi:hypothetical protein
MTSSSFPPEPPRDLVSSDRVRLLTSWKLWLPLLFLAAVMIAGVIFWPAFRRMQALDLIEARGGQYVLGEPRWPWLAEKLGSLGMGFHPVIEFEVYNAISLKDLEVLSRLGEAKRVSVRAGEVTLEWIDVIETFPHLDYLAFYGEFSEEVLEELFRRLPKVEVAHIGTLTDADADAVIDLQGRSQLQQLWISGCPRELTMAGFPDLQFLTLDQMKDASLTIRELPSLEQLYLTDVNAGTSLEYDAPLKQLAYGTPKFERLEVPPRVFNMYIQHLSGCTVTGGEDLKSLTIYESSDVTVEGMPALRQLECTRFSGGTTQLRDLPRLEHLVLMDVVGFHSPTMVFEGVDNLRAIDAPWWGADDAQVKALCALPKLEHLVISRAEVTRGILPFLQGVETLRFLRFPREVREARHFAVEVDFDELRREFPQPGIRIHGPARQSEEGDRWTPTP